MRLEIFDAHMQRVLQIWHKASDGFKTLRFGKDSGRCTVVCHAHCVTDVTHDIVSTITNFLETIGASLCAADLAELKSKIEG